MNHALKNIALIAAFAAVAGIWLFRHQGQTGSVRVGANAPPLVVQMQGKGDVELSSLQGNWVVLNFWASYCPPCRKEAPDLTRVHQSLRRRGGSVVGVSTEDLPPAAITMAANSLGMRYPVAAATEEALQPWQIGAIPTTYLINPEGQIAWSRVGAIHAKSLLERLEELKHE